MLIALQNNFHQTRIHIRRDVGDRLTRAQVRYYWRRLCGITNCSCGNAAGERGSCRIVQTSATSYSITGSAEEMGAAYARWMRMHNPTEAVPLDRDRLTNQTADIPPDDYRRMCQLQIDPDTRAYWRGYNAIVKQ